MKKFATQQYITGEPYYQVYKNFDYWLKFNNQNAMEERNVKLLLCLPLIPVRHHREIKLNSFQKLTRNRSPLGNQNIRQGEMMATSGNEFNRRHNLM